MTTLWKPCPFCGSSVVQLSEDCCAVDFICAIECQNCGTLGPAMATYENAIEAWNTRAGQTDTDTDSEDGK